MKFEKITCNSLEELNNARYNYFIEEVRYFLLLYRVYKNFILILEKDSSTTSF